MKLKLLIFAFVINIQLNNGQLSSEDGLRQPKPDPQPPTQPEEESGFPKQEQRPHSQQTEEKVDSGAADSPFGPMFRSVFDEPFPMFDRKFPFENFPEMAPFSSFPNPFKNEKPIERESEQAEHVKKDNMPIRMPFFSSVSMVSNSEHNPFELQKSASEMRDEMSKDFPRLTLPRIRLIEEKPQLPSIMNSFNPLNDMDREVNKIGGEDRNNTSDHISLVVGWSVHTLEDNSSLPSNDSNRMHKFSFRPVKDFMHHILDSFTHFRKLIKSIFKHDDNNGTDSMPIASTDQTPADRPAIMIQCDCPDDKHDENCPNMVEKHDIDRNTDTTSQTPAMVNVDIEVEEKMEPNNNRIDSESDIMKDMRASNDALMAADKEIRVKNSPKVSYEWYDYMLIATFSVSILAIFVCLALFCVKRLTFNRFSDKYQNNNMDNDRKLNDKC